MKLNSSSNGYRLVLYRKTENGYDVISPYDLNKAVTKQVYEAAMGIVESNGYVPGQQGKLGKEIAGMQKERKKHLETIKELQKTIREVRAVVKGV